MQLEHIFVHCSASEFGDTIRINRWHKRRGWACIGYHYVVLNGRPNPRSGYFSFLDGEIQPGRFLDDDPHFESHEIGSHVKHYNDKSIGICLIGKTHFTKKQFESLKMLVNSLLKQYPQLVDFNCVLGHYEGGSSKTCPNMPMDSLRAYLAGTMSVEKLIDDTDKHIEKLYS